MGWLGLLKLGLQLVNLIAGIVREKQLLDAGEARGVAKSMAATADRLGIGQALAGEIEAMTLSELDDALRGDK